MCSRFTINQHCWWHRVSKICARIKPQLSSAKSQNCNSLCGDDLWWTKTDGTSTNAWMPCSTHNWHVDKRCIWSIYHSNSSFYHWFLGVAILCSYDLGHYWPAYRWKYCQSPQRRKAGIWDMWVFALVTNNATNMVMAASEAGMPKVPCFSHTLQLAVNDGLKIIDAARAIAAGRRVVAYFSHSAMSTQALKEHQSVWGHPNPCHSFRT